MSELSSCTIAQGAKPSRVRWRICLFLFFTTALAFLDRLNISVAGKGIQEEFAISNEQLGLIFSAFGLGYALFQVPSGMLGDHFGPRRVLTFAVVCWSIFTVLTAAVDLLPFSTWVGLPIYLAVTRFLIGAGQAPVFPNANKVITFWMPPSERARGNSFFVMGVGLGGVVTPPLLAWMTAALGWRTAFVVCGVVGFFFAAWWWLYSTETPAEHRGVNAAELAVIREGQTGKNHSPSSRGIPWKTVLTHRTVWALIVSYMLLGYTTYVFYTWFYLYVVNVRGLPSIEGGFWSSFPFAAFGVMSLVGGVASDRAVKWFGLKWGRRTCVLSGTWMAAAVLLIGSRVEDPHLAVWVLSLGAGFNAFAAVSWWAVTIDLTQEFAASLSGLMNMAGNLGGTISPALTPYIAERLGWTAAIDAAAFTIAVAGLLWFVVNAEEALSVEQGLPAFP